MWFLEWQLGRERQKDMLREAEQRRRWRSIQRQNVHPTLRVVRVRAGSLLIAAGHLLVTGTSKSQMPASLKQT